jgi:hypothetical protein
MTSDGMDSAEAAGKPKSDVHSAKIIAVNFRSDTLFAVEHEDGVFVAVKPISDTLGLIWRKQQERISRDPILAEGSNMVVIPSPGGPQETTCLRLDLVNGWLFGIDESQVKDEETRQKVLAYKRECYRVLFDHFYRKATVIYPPGDAEGSRRPARPNGDRSAPHIRHSGRCAALDQARFANGPRDAA